MGCTLRIENVDSNLGDLSRLRAFIFFYSDFPDYCVNVLAVSNSPDLFLDCNISFSPQTSDLRKLIHLYREWAYQVSPRLPFLEVIEKIEALGKQQYVRTCQTLRKSNISEDVCNAFYFHGGYEQKEIDIWIKSWTMNKMMNGFDYWRRAEMQRILFHSSVKFSWDGWRCTRKGLRKESGSVYKWLGCNAHFLSFAILICSLPACSLRIHRFSDSQYLEGVARNTDQSSNFE